MILVLKFVKQGAVLSLSVKVFQYLEAANLKECL